ncbi:DUF6453 family protein [Pantoea ananatis]|uniref:DUF6453 family protein n=1 Tax=Pantoea ananas TaxID=553 RepID=UPI003F971B22
MADIIGLRIIPDDGQKPVVLDGSMRYASYLGNCNLYSAGSTVSVTRPQRANSRAMIIPRTTLSIGANISASGPPMKWATSISFDGSNVRCTSESINANNNNTVIGNVDVFSVQQSESPVNTYGLRIVNGSNFMEISDTGYAGYVTYRDVITINGSWTVPQSITSLGDYIIYARWNNTDFPLFFDRSSNTITTWTGFGSTDGSVQGGTVSNVQIVIVSCGFSPALPVSGYGLVIRNAAGQVTYSSKYPPVAWPDAYYNFGYYKLGDDGSGDYLNWVSPTGSVTAPMLPLCTIGFQRGDFNRGTGTYNFRKCLQSGFKMSGNSVSTSRAKTTLGDMEVQIYPRALQVACQLPCIDASYYF